jgi:D-glycero-alpha-D-manno-heptose-7-phosphate kinase
MIITRTPLRISFFGGGIDYPAWFTQHKGAVLATTIDKYVYITCRYLPPFFEHRSKIVWSLVELVKSIDEIQHPSVRACLKFMHVNKGVEIHYDADLPAKSGLGSSSAFTVGLLNSLYALKGKAVSKKRLADDAVYVEQKKLRENVGCQDQIAAAMGGLNLVEFSRNGEYAVTPVTVVPERIQELEKNLLLVFTGFTRVASEIAGSWIAHTRRKQSDFSALYESAHRGYSILTGRGSLRAFGKLLDESWKIKRGLDTKISTPMIDETYRIARASGAIGGKILGAGGGGFLLLYADPVAQRKIKARLKKLLCIPFRFENFGSQVIFYHPFKQL